MESEWSSLHIYLHGGLEHTDRFLVDCLAPLADATVADQDASSWFFLRYWAGGPHVRFRLAGAEAATVQRLSDEITQWISANPVTGQASAEPATFYRRAADRAEHGWYEHGTVLAQQYQPEVERYGGAVALPAAERLFAESSQVAVAALRGSLAGPRRLSAGYHLMLAFADAVCDTDAAEVAMLRRYVYSARYNTAEAPQLELTAIREQAERDYAGAPGRYRAAAEKLRALIGGDEHAGYLGHWARCAGEYAATVRTLAEAGELTGYASAWTMLLSQLHMLLNRIGVSLAEEYQLAWLASLVIAGAGTGEGYHDHTLAGAGRRYHEQSKYAALNLARQLPRPVERSSAAINRGRPTGSVELPAPSERELPRPLLTDCLAARRSSLTGYHGEVPAGDLSALLLHAAGEQLLSVPVPGGDPIELPARPHPSAGALHAAELLVLPARVPGVDPAIYRYQPHGHLLHPVAPAPSAAALAASSPYLDPASAVSLRVADVPLWLFVTGDIAAATERYGLRGYRFLLLEAGHLAQNVVLMATALGYRSVTIGGFHDDALSQLLELDGVNAAPFYAIPVGNG